MDCHEPHQLLPPYPDDICSDLSCLDSSARCYDDYWDEVVHSSINDESSGRWSARWTPGRQTTADNLATRQKFEYHRLVAYCRNYGDDGDELHQVATEDRGKVLHGFRECQWPCRPVLPRDASTSSQTLLDLLPLELWQKILSYLNDNDGYLYSLLEASEKFAELLPKSSHPKLSDDGFWHAALLKRGCFKSTAGWLDSSKDGSFWRRRYNYVVHSMACFPCFSDITPADEITPLLQFRDSFMGRISREVEKLGRASVCSRHLIRQPSAYSRSDIVDVQFCNVDVKNDVSLQQIDKVILTFLGSPATPYVGGLFRLLLYFPSKYPFQPPQARMLTKIFSPYFTKHGDFYHPYSKFVSTRYDCRKFWTAHNTVEHLVDLVGQYLSLSVPSENEREFFPGKLVVGQVVNKDVGEMWINDRKLFNCLAERFTHRFAIEFYQSS